MNDNLTVVEQREVTFYGDELTAVRLANGRIFVPVRPLVEALGLAWSSQFQRIRRDPVLKTELFSVFVTNTESQRGGRDVQCLPLGLVRTAKLNKEKKQTSIKEYHHEIWLYLTLQ